MVDRKTDSDPRNQRTRRRILHGGMAAGLLALGIKPAKDGLSRRSRPPGGEGAKPEPTPVVWETGNSLFDLVFHISDPEFQENAHKEVEQYKLLYKNNVEENPKILMRLESNIASVKSVLTDDTFPKEILFGLLYVESGGDSTKISPTGRKGLLQLSEDTAKSYGISDRTDPDQNLLAGLRYLNDLQRMFNSDLGLTLLAFNTGQGAVYNALSVYFNHDPLDITQPQEIQEKRAIEYNNLIKKNHLSIHTLLQNPNVRAILDDDNNEQLSYVYKVLAATEIWQEYLRNK